ncbi:MAG TPA: SPOR domain-containing protein [Limnochordales bacterium]
MGAFNDRTRADGLAAELRARGYEVFVSGTPPHRVQVGAFSESTRARALADDLQAQGFEAIVVPPG